MKSKSLLKNFLFIVLIFLIISGVFAILNPESFQKPEEMPFSQLAQEIEDGKIKEITISGDELSVGYFSDTDAEADTEIISRKETGVSLIESLQRYGISQEKIAEIKLNIQPEKEGAWAWLFPILGLAVPVLIFGWFFFMIFKQAKGGAGQGLSFLKPPAKLFGDGKGPKEKVTFNDIAGLEEAKAEIKEVVDFLKNPKKYYKIGARIPRGVLLVGAPGTGKTMLARALATEAGVPFFSIVGSSFIELFVGVGSSRVRALFQEAKKHKASIIFIDELDAIGKMRMPGIGGGHEEREQTLNQILAEMDGFERETGIIVVAATNKPEILDPALLRPGRFDRRIVFDLPDVKGREAILKIHCIGKPLALDVKIKETAERTPGFSGADLANLVNEAAISTARKDKTQIFQQEFLESIEKVILGPERKSHLLSKKEKEISAYHEAGHALVAASIPGAEKIRKISIVARGMAAGYTLAMPSKEKRIKTKTEFLAELSMLLGGYCAEKIKYNEISTGASNDLEKISLLARALVTKYGMSKLGPIVFGKRDSLAFLGFETESERNYSEKIAGMIDKEIERFIKEAEQRATKILKSKKKILEKIAKALIEKETIEKEEFERLVGSVAKRKK